MSLTRKQKQQILKLSKREPIQLIAQKTGISLEEIQDYFFIKGNEIPLSENQKNALSETIQSRITNINLQWFIAHKWVFISLAIVVFLLYANAINNDFVSDDKVFFNYPEVLTLDFIVTQPQYYMRGLVYFVVFKLFGLSAPAFRLPSIFFHIGVVWLLYIIVWIMDRPLTALIAALLFAVHPILVESITWISGGVYPQYSFFILLGLLFFMLSYRSKKYHWYSFAAFSTLLMTSERALFFPGILLAYLVSVGQIKKNKKSLFILFGIGSIMAAFIPFLFMERLQSLIKTTYHAQGFDNPLIQIPVAIANYLFLIFWPQHLTLYQTEVNPSTLFYIIEAIITIIFFVGVYVSYKNNRFIFFFLSLFIVSLLPFLTPFRISWVVAERYVYLGTAGIIAVFAYGVVYASKKIPHYRELILGFIIIIAVALGVRTFYRNIDWKNEDNLWIATVKASPSSPNAYNNIGDVYARSGDLENAARAFKRATEIKPDYGDAYHNLANVLVKMQRDDEAIAYYLKALETNQYLWQSHVQLAGIYVRRENYEVALSELSVALSISPNNPEILTSYAILYSMTGDVVNAQKYARTVLQIQPNNQKALEILRQTNL